jgi:peptide deformylase
VARQGIRLYGDPVLRTKARPVAPDDDETRALVEDLFDTVHAAGGIGLAAPQIGVPARVFVVDLSPVELGAKPLVLINPEIVRTGTAVTGEEGCLSFPGLFVNVDRPEEARVRYRTPSGEPREVEVRGLLARAVLHEFDHLEGVLFIDGLSAARRVLIAARLKQMQRRQKKGETV